MPKIDAQQLQKDLRDLVAEIVEAKPEDVTLEADFVNDLGMDSMQALEILAAVEKKYKVQVPEEYIGKLSNLSSLINVAEEILGGK